jgi:hypothetical protein
MVSVGQAAPDVPLPPQHLSLVAAALLLSFQAGMLNHRLEFHMGVLHVRLVSADAAFVANAGQDWELCQNGTRHHGAVLAAVLQFALRHAAQVSRMPSAYGDSWMMLKPYRRSPDMHPS